jgi:hypothetical protein
MTVICCLLSVLAAAPRAATRPASAPAGEGRPPTIQVVRTLAELQAQPVIRIGKGSAARLGISADRVPIGSAVVVYCLWEGTSWAQWPKPGFQWMSECRFLGPLRLCWTDRQTHSAGRLGMPAHPEGNPPSPVLLRTLLPVRKEGPQRLGVYIYDRTPLGEFEATATVHGTRPAAQAWTVLLSSRWELDGGGAPEALPNLSGLQWTPIAEVKKGALPGIVPAKAGKLRLQIKADLLTLSADQDLSSRPDRYTLLRFWLNGKPVRWTGRCLLLMDRGIEVPVPSVTGRIRWPDLLPGLKAGDRVRVQALFCYCGWWNTGEEEVRTSLASPWRAARPSLLSRPVEFVYQPPPTTTRPSSATRPSSVSTTKPS